MKKLRLSYLFILLLTAACGLAQDLTLTVETERNPMRYRAKLSSQSKSSVEFEMADFTIVRDMAPYGARILVRDGALALIYQWNQENGYSANDMISTIDTKPRVPWRTLAAGETWVSEWFLVDDITHGLNQAGTEKDPKRWHSFKIRFWTRVRSKTPGGTAATDIKGESGWVGFGTAGEAAGR